MKKPSPLAITLTILAVITGALVALSGFYVDWLWFQSVGFTGVWSTVLTTKVALFYHLAKRLCGISPPPVLCSNFSRS
jgi:uncharacterized membrane protein (UPF0182 family)